MHGTNFMDPQQRIRDRIDAEYESLRVVPGEDWAQSARYRSRRRVLRLELRSGVALEIPVRMIQILARASPVERAKVRVEGRGLSLYWPLLDEGLSVPNLVAEVFGTQIWMRELARRGGSVKSVRKAAAARANGIKGGRPRKRGARAAQPPHGSLPQPRKD